MNRPRAMYYVLCQFNLGRLSNDIEQIPAFPALI